MTNQSAKRAKVLSAMNFGGLLVVSILFFASPIAIVYGFMHFVLDPVVQGFEARPYTVAMVLEEVPKEPAFYCFVAALVGVGLSWRWWMLANLRNKFKKHEEADDGSSLTTRDWEVATGFRGRALALRTRADLLLGAGFALLLAGVYFVLFIVPEVAGTDSSRIANALFADRFGSRLDCIVTGQCWAKTEPRFVEDLERSIQESYSKNGFDAKSVSKVSVLEFGVNDGAGRLRGNVELGPGEAVTAVELSADGTIGLVAGTRGSVFTTANGGNNWRPGKAGLGQVLFRALAG